MKKRNSLIMAFVLCAMMLAGCSGAKSEENVNIRVAGLTGATSMGLVKMIEDNNATAAESEKYEFTVAGSADELTPAFVQGDLDIIAVPANLASVLYNNTEGKVQILAINTLGVTYIVENGDSVQSIADLKGKTIYATGKGSIPEYTLRYILSENGIDPDKDVTFEWKSEPNEVVALMSEQKGVIAMLPQPYVTVAGTKVEGLRTAVNLNQEWDYLGNNSKMITGVLVARKAFVEEHPQAVAKFMEEYQKSIEYANSDAEGAASLIEKYGIIKAAVAQKALPYCNITYIAGTDMKVAMQGYLQILYDQNPKSVGGELPADDFYYEK